MSLLDDKEQIIEKIIESSGKSKEEIEKLIEDKKGKFSGLLTDSGAAFMVAKDLNVNLDLSSQVSEKLKVNQLKDGLNNVDIDVTVKQIFAEKSFESKGKKGKLVNLIVEDETGETRLTLWNKDAEILNEKNLVKGAKISLKNCYVTSYNDQPQLNFGYNGELIVNENGRLERTPLNELKESENSVNAVGRLLRKFELREFETERGKGKVLNFEIADETKKIRAAAWNDLTEVVNGIEDGEIIFIGNAYTKKGLNDEIELNLGWSARILKNPNIDFEIPEAEKFLPKTDSVKINELKEGDSNKELKGIVVAINPGKLYYTKCKTCNKKAEMNEEGKYICDNCGETEAEKNLIISFELDDGFGVIRSVCFGKTVEDLLETPKNELLEKLENKGEEKVIEEIKEKNVGKRIKAIGNASKNEVQNSLEFIARSIRKVSEDDIEKETEQLLDSI